MTPRMLRLDTWAMASETSWSCTVRETPSAVAAPLLTTGANASLGVCGAPMPASVACISRYGPAAHWAVETDVGGVGAVSAWVSVGKRKTVSRAAPGEKH